MHYGRQRRPRPGTRIGDIYDRLVAGEEVEVPDRDRSDVIHALRESYELAILCLGPRRYRLKRDGE